MKVLLSAFSCGPGRGSEPGVGWNWLLQISREHEVWLLTTDEFRDDILGSLPPNVHPTFLPSYRRWARLQWRGIPALSWCYYYWWQWKAYRLARRLERDVKFDLAHHLTFCSWRAPSFLCLLPVPLVWGPLGGGEQIPKCLRGELSLKGRIFELVRAMASWCSRWDPFVRLTMRRAALILVANHDTLNVIPAVHRHKVRTLMSVGISRLEKTEAIARAERPGGFVVLFAAVLESWKGGTLAMRAFERLARSIPDATLVVIGRGSEQASLAALAERLGIADHVRFLGMLPRARVLSWMHAADVFLLPGLRDSAGFVFLEAMAAGKPVVCLDLGGPGEIVAAECGIKVPVHDPDQVVRDLGIGLKTLAADAALRHGMGERGRRRVREQFDWDRKGTQMLDLYLDLTAFRSAELCGVAATARRA